MLLSRTTAHQGTLGSSQAALGITASLGQKLRAQTYPKEYFALRGAVIAEENSRPDDCLFTQAAGTHYNHSTQQKDQTKRDSRHFGTVVLLLKAWSFKK